MVNSVVRLFILIIINKESAQVTKSVYHYALDIKAEVGLAAADVFLRPERVIVDLAGLFVLQGEEEDLALSRILLGLKKLDEFLTVRHGVPLEAVFFTELAGEGILGFFLRDCFLDEE